MAPRGRKTKLTPALQEKFIRAVRAGNCVETCCDYVGINPDTYYEWQKRGQQGGAANEIYREFRAAVLDAQASAEIESVARIRLSGQKGNWRADAWYLERRHPDRWGRQRLELTGKDGEPVTPGAVVIIPSNGRDDA
ncbi:hypothetical protein [Deinococcus multiflagellatus]|uniref:Terminase small subunit n=1 Tax=Deinococcus multiflagellatus TaxID=1656887 RepID=A0ABW1ZRY5_9DEIO|nr:hypothetical protein [Deinococcus multiflagellatus]MBZ9715506.1 hypothetical protein [Deinococcus multiflagellatus]